MKAPDTSKARVLVVGDVMLDRYWYGDVSRISPEAPVPVVLVREQDEELRLGGAGNVARNCKALGAEVRLLSVIGKDEAGRQLAKLAKHEGLDARLHADGKLRTLHAPAGPVGGQRQPVGDVRLVEDAFVARALALCHARVSADTSPVVEPAAAELRGEAGGVG